MPVDLPICGDARPKFGLIVVEVLAHLHGWRNTSGSRSFPVTAVVEVSW